MIHIDDCNAMLPTVFLRLVQRTDGPVLQQRYVAGPNTETPEEQWRDVPIEVESP